ncbi:maltotransferase domain-containing protein, partial [Cellulosimicrobium funkei]|uniref:maltotransferase domain-containing protein n=1 Tax=Cellulosimicrobium funkei TaxID=264251 RepID=UPI003F8DA175
MTSTPPALAPHRPRATGAPRPRGGAPAPAPAAPVGRIPVLEVSPVVEGGRWPAKAVVGEMVPIEATVFREGHDAVAATAVLVAPDGTERTAPMVDVAPGLDRFRATLHPDAVGDWSLRVEAWSDPYGTWAHDATVKVAAGVDVELMLAEGVRLFERVLADAVPLPGRDGTPGRRTPADERTLADALAALADATRPAEARLVAATSPEVRDVLERAPLRDHVTASATYPLRVERPLAHAGAWFENLPRNEGAPRLKDGRGRSG